MGGALWRRAPPPENGKRTTSRINKNAISVFTESQASVRVNSEVIAVACSSTVAWIR